MRLEVLLLTFWGCACIFWFEHVVLDFTFYTLRLALREGCSPIGDVQLVFWNRNEPRDDACRSGSFI